MALTQKQVEDELQYLTDRLHDLEQKLGPAIPGQATFRDAIEEHHAQAKDTDYRLRRYEAHGLRSVISGFGNWMFGRGAVALTNHGLEFFKGGNGQGDPGITWNDPAEGLLDLQQEINAQDKYINITGLVSDASELFIQTMDTTAADNYETDLQMTMAPNQGYSSINMNTYVGNVNGGFIIFSADGTENGNGNYASYVTISSGVFAIGDTGVIEVTIASDQNNYAPAEDASETWYSTTGLRLASAAARNITGFAEPGSPKTNLPWPIHLVWNASSFNITLKANSGSSSAANQVDLPGDLTLLPSHGCWLLYDQTSAKWRPIHTSDILHDAAWDAKGDSVWGISADTAQKISVGSDGYFINALASETVGVKWNPFTLLNDISATISANTDDWAPTGISTASVIRATTTASWNLTGITTGADGRVLLLLNVGSNNLVLKDDVTSTAANRFQLNGDVTLAADEACFLWYDATSSRWRMAGHYAAASAGSGYTTVQDEGVGLTQRSTMNFTGAGVTAADSGGITVVTIPGGGGTTIANDTIWAAKGDLAAATGNDAAAVLTVGADGYALFADSSTSTGLRWKPMAGVIQDPSQWLSSAGYEFWILPGHADLINASSATNQAGLDSYGWTTTALTIVEGTTGDFLSSADEDDTRLDFNASGDTLTSPVIFGSYAHALQASKFLGAMPTKLCLEARLQMYVSSANEVGTFFGFVGSAVTDVTAAGSGAGIYGDATNFKLASDTNTDAGAAVDTSIHTWRIEVSSATTEWFIDDVSQGTMTTETDVWPAALKFRASTTNRMVLMWARVYYA